MNDPGCTNDRYYFLDFHNTMGSMVHSSGVRKNLIGNSV